MNSRFSPWLLPALFLACGCGGDRAGADREAGEAEAPMPITLESRLGSVDDPDQTFASPGTVLLGHDGDLWLTQPLAGEIWRYDAENRRVGRLGGRGEGPGEFAVVGGITLAGDTLLATDRALQRLTRFGPDGSVLGSVRWASPESFPGPDGSTFAATVPPVILPDGTGLVAPSRIWGGRDFDLDPGLGTRDVHQAYLRIDAEGEVLDTLWHTTTQTIFAVEPEGGGRLSTFTCPAEDQGISVLMPGGSGILFVDRTHAPTFGAGPAVSQPDVRLTLLSPSGDTLRVDSIPYSPIPFDPSDITAILEAELDFARGRGVPVPDAGRAPEAFEEADCSAETVPPVQAAIPMRDGSVWLAWAAGRVTSDSVDWRIVAPGGGVRGPVRLPGNVIPVDAAGDRFVARELGELDVPYIRRYRLGG